MKRFKLLLAVTLLANGTFAYARPYQDAGQTNFCPAPADHSRYIRFLYWFIPC